MKKVHLDETDRAIQDKQNKSEKKNYTYRLPIYYAEMFRLVCEKKGLATADRIEEWIIGYVKPFEAEFKKDVVQNIEELIKAKKEHEKTYRDKQNRKRKS